MTSKTTRYFAAACIIGVVHAAFSGYWAAGGRWMLGTVGSWATEWVDTDPGTARSVLAGLTVFKLAAAVLPLLALLGMVPLRPLIFAISWAGSVLLIVWGGLSFVGAVIGLIASDDNREVKIGHLFFDGAFFLWGAALLAGLVSKRRADQRVAVH
ncbi:DUF3995 domain-containing protein [Rhodococcus sp. 1168]|uniref:DUF3995 domain-containing protein n=1 Tax=Rhodococcus sp. 1168 TaxID=2018041 RepID=UPI000A0CA714|nr:DUF3995 domain-containing protein [Rhodococcus sp. 1168]ORI21241.1 hypothetical protein BJI47_17610 [Rhodococcus sp. 1168]